MQRLFFLLLSMIFVLPIFGRDSKIDANGVQMTGFRQEWNDKHAYIVLLNNTELRLSRVKGTLSFFSESGQLLDERSFNEHVKLQPGEMAEIAISPFGRKQGYVSSNCMNRIPSDAQAQEFTVRFTLTDYKGKEVANLPVSKREQRAIAQAEAEATAAQTKEADEKLWNIIRITAGVLILLFIAVFYFLIPIRMADRRGRSWMPWVVVGIVATPIIPILALWLIGKKEVDRTE